jgi:hypothetical protein
VQQRFLDGTAASEQAKARAEARFARRAD